MFFFVKIYLVRSKNIMRDNDFGVFNTFISILNCRKVRIVTNLEIILVLKKPMIIMIVGTFLSNIP